MPQELTNGRAARPRPLKAEQLLSKVIRPLYKLKGRLKKINDPALPEIVKQIEAMEHVLWELRHRRELAEAIAADKGEISWIVFHPRGRTIFDLNKIVTRTPRTIHVKNEYWTQRDEVRLADIRSIDSDLEKELHREPLDLAKFAEHARLVDESYRKYLARGGPEAEKEAA